MKAVWLEDPSEYAEACLNPTAADQKYNSGAASSKAVKTLSERSFHNIILRQMEFFVDRHIRCCVPC